MPTAAELRAQRVSEEMDTPGNQCRHSYIVLAEMRSGSTLICDLLHRCGAGVPIEYLNSNYRNDFSARLGLPGRSGSLNQYMAAVRSLRTSKSGHFGIHCLYRDLASLGMPAAAAFLQQFDSIIVISRRNKLAQAISAVRARQTGRWESTVTPTEPGREKFDAIAIAEQIYRALKFRQFVDGVLASIDRRKLSIEYEAIRDSLETVWHDVQGLLHLAPVSAASIGSPLQRQADSRSDDFARRYLDLLQGKPERDGSPV